MTALTWALEVGDPQRFPSIARAVSYCGLTSALVSSADKQQRGPISKQRNAHLQTVLIEAAKLAPRWNPQLAAVHEQEVQRGQSQSGDLAGGAQAGGLSVGGGQIRKAVPNPHCSNHGSGGGNRGLNHLTGVHGRPPFPCTVDCGSGGGGQGFASRAKLRRALDLPFASPKDTEKRERGAGTSPNSELRAPIGQRSTGRSSP